MNNLKLYIWEDVLCAGECGKIIALAENVDDARQVVREQNESHHSDFMIDMATCKEPREITDKKAFIMWGAG